MKVSSRFIYLSPTLVFLALIVMMMVTFTKSFIKVSHQLPVSNRMCFLSSAKSMTGRHRPFRQKDRIIMSTTAANLQKEVRKTGSFLASLPDVHPSATHFRRAMRSTRDIKVDSEIKNIRNANRKHSAQVIDTLMQALTKPITEMLNTYQKQLKRLHPFEVNILRPFWLPFPFLLIDIRKICHHYLA